MVPFSMSTHLIHVGLTSVLHKGTDVISCLSTSAWPDTAASCYATSLKWGPINWVMLLVLRLETPQTLSLPRKSLPTGAEVLDEAKAGILAAGDGTHIEGTRAQLSCCGRWGWAMQFLLFVREKHKSGSCRRCWHRQELVTGWVGNSHGWSGERGSG